VARGKAIVAARETHCVLCHEVPGLPGPMGDVGPALAGVGARLSQGELRLRIVDSTRVNPATRMPSYHRVEGLRRVAPELRGKPVLSAQQVEDVVAFLGTLR
jgi:sulfur-oxidizing protein SoxX